MAAMNAPGLATAAWQAFAVSGAPEDRWTLRDGRNVAIRAVRADDAARIQAMVQALSPRTRYLRFFNPLHELPPALLASFTEADPFHAMTILATIEQDGEERVVGMAHYFSEDYPEQCEFALLVADGWQGAGLGARLLHNLICIAVAAGFGRMEGELLAENITMRRLALSHAFTLAPHPGGAYLVKALKTLVQPAWKCSQLAALARHASHRLIH